MSEPPLVRRLFGDHWDDLKSHPDCWNRYFGEDSDEETESAEEKRQKQELAGRNLLDHNWIKQKLDEEIIRYLIDDVKREENRELIWRRSKLLMLACILAIAAQFPFLITVDTPFLYLLSWTFIGSFYFFYVLAYLLLLNTPWNSIIEIKASESEGGFFVETNLPKYTVEYNVLLRSVDNRTIIDSFTISATELFTFGADLCPQPLHDKLSKSINNLRALLKKT